MTLPTSPSHLGFIHTRVPAWLHNASPAQRALLKQRVLASQRASRRIRAALASLQPIEQFCRPLLETALARWYPGQVLPAVDSAQAWDIDANRGCNWLEAALQNYDDGAQVKLRASPSEVQALALDATRFVKGVRNLDLGQRYRDHLGEHIDTDGMRSLLAAQDRAAFAATLSLARLQGHLDDRGAALGEAVLAGASTLHTLQHGEQPIECAYLSLFDAPLNGPLLIRLAPQGTVEACLLYLPGDAEQPLRQYTSMSAVGKALAARLRDARFRGWFCESVSHRERVEVTARVRQRLFPSHPYANLLPAPVLPKGESFSWVERLFPGPRDVWQATLDLNAQVPLRATPWPDECFAARARVMVERKFEDAASIAVPVAQRDAAAQLARIEAWLGAGLSVLNVAGLFVPGLGEAMLVVGAGQLVDEFLEGVHDANEGQADTAVAHLFDVLENLVQFAALGSAATFIEPAGELHAWHLIGDGDEKRLWHGELTPFARPRPWTKTPALTPEGLRHWQGQHWAEVDGQAYPVEADHPGSWQLAGQPRLPRLTGNGQGTWLLDHELPQAWPEAQLLARLGPAADGLDAEQLQRALRCSGYDAPALREVLANHRPLPALLLDSLQALGADTQQVPLTPHPGDALLARDFPGLSPRSRQEILEQAQPADLKQLQQHQRLPLNINETARLYLREARISRALARLHQTEGPTQDRDRLVFAGLQRLPGWTGQVRIELRAGSPRAALLAVAGEDGVEHKTVLALEDGYEPQDASGLVLANRSGLPRAILQALPDSEREALGLQVDDQDALRDRLFEQLAGNRDQTAIDLGMAPVRPQYRLPTRLPGTRKLGYALSGRGAGWITDTQLLEQLYPGLDPQERSQLRAHLLHQAGGSAYAFNQLLERLRAEYRQLDQALLQWAQDPAGAAPDQLLERQTARHLATQRIRQAWRREEPGSVLASWDYVALDIDATYLGGLPQLPVSLPHVRQLQVSGLASVHANHLEHFLPAFPNVRNLDLSVNGLSQLPAALGGLEHLQVLDLSENALDLAREDDVNALVQLSQLQQLNLSDALQDLPVSALDRLAQLPALRALQLDLNLLALDASHFQALQRWPALTHLSLGQNEIVLSQDSRAALAGLSSLQRLFLYENPLGLAPDVRGWTELEQLDLEMTHLQTWPAGLEALMDQQPLRLASIDLSRNDLTELPNLANTAFARQIRAGNRGVSFSIDGNPLTEASLDMLEAAGLPFDPWAEPNAEWLTDWPPALAEHVRAVRDEGTWAPLFALFDRVSNTTEYHRHPETMRLRMRSIVQQLVSDPAADAEDGWGRVQVRQRIVELLQAGADTCVDQASLQFQQVETEVIVWQTLAAAAPGAANEQVAVDALASLLRERLLDERVAALYDARMARRRALAEAQDDASRAAAPALHADDLLDDETLSAPNLLLDEMEMALHARMHLRVRLGLPPQPGEIAFDYLAHLSQTTLEHLADGVLGDTTPARLREWGVTQPFWQAWLRRLRPEAFEQLANEWAGASEYFDSLGEATDAPGAYTGPAVPDGYIDALQHELGDTPGLHWRVDGHVQRVDLVSGHYPGEGELYRRAGEVLLRSREAAEAQQLAQLTAALIDAWLTH